MPADDRGVITAAELRNGVRLLRGVRGEGVRCLGRLDRGQPRVAAEHQGADTVEHDGVSRGEPQRGAPSAISQQEPRSTASNLTGASAWNRSDQSPPARNPPVITQRASTSASISESGSGTMVGL